MAKMQRIRLLLFNLALDVVIVTTLFLLLLLL